jgi:hypothetical protein
MSLHVSYSDYIGVSINWPLRPVVQIRLAHKSVDLCRCQLSEILKVHVSLVWQINLQ